MNQAPKKKRKLPKDIVERSDHEVMEKLFGKRVMKKVDELVTEEPKGRKDKGN